MNKFIRKIVNRLKRKSNVEIARDLGVRVGQNSLILCDPYECFGSEPYLVELGDHVEVTGGCRFVTHDGAVWVLRQEAGLEKIDKFGKITVGNNVFIGINSTILPGVTIGDNCIVGACSLVTTSIPSGEVWGGVPAKKICSLDEYKMRAMPFFDYTKGLSPQKKEEAVRAAHPEWLK